MKATKQRIVLFKECDRRCKGCCNKDWDLDNLPKATNYRGFERHILTGGEPLLNPALIVETVGNIRKVSKSPIVIYTAKCKDIPLFIRMLDIVEGMTLTLHGRGDIAHFKALNDYLIKSGRYAAKSLWLNVFSNVKLDSSLDLSLWRVKDNIEWIKDCPLPKGEILMRL